MTNVIAEVLGTAAWLGGVFVLLVMALLPLLEQLGTPGRRQ
jgi:hypothetical protein